MGEFEKKKQLAERPTHTFCWPGVAQCCCAGSGPLTLGWGLDVIQGLQKQGREGMS